MSVEFELDGCNVDVSEGIYLKDGTPTAEARAFAAEIVARLDNLRAFAAKKLRKTYNDAWRDEDEPVLKAEAFCARLVRPTFLILDEVGSGAVFFEDSDLFAGHSIQVDIDDGRPTRATLVG